MSSAKAQRRYRKRKWRELHREEIKAKARAYYAKNAKHIRKRQNKNYSIRNPPKVRSIDFGHNVVAWKHFDCVASEELNPLEALMLKEEQNSSPH